MKNNFEFTDSFSDLVKVSSMHGGNGVRVEFQNRLTNSSAHMLFDKRHIRDLEKIVEILKQNA